MDFQKRSRRSLIKPKFTILEEKYPHFMQLYREYPTDEISFKEFEECTAERLSLLQVIDEVSSKGLKGEEWAQMIKTELRKLPELRQFSKLVTGTKCHDSEADFMIRKRDHISHFVLRLAYCSSEDKRRWLISREMDLFRFRWMHLSDEDRQMFLKINNLNYEVVSKDSKRELENATQGMIQSSLDYYKIPFILVSDLIRNRRVFLKKGYAYITSNDIISVILTSFRSHLSQSLSYVSRRVHQLDEDERIFSVLKGAGNNVRQVDYVIEDKEKINIATLDDLAASSFPLCMQNLHKNLRQDHHLKYFGRQQYGLFLKGIGVTLEDALTFWRSEFLKKMDLDKFEKSYSYNIRHNYGKEGKMANYTPHSCLKIITSSVNPGDNHGCPFRHKDPVLVKRMLENNGLSTIACHEIIGLIRKNQYQLACGKYFQIKHNSEFGVNHPNAYFDESQRILREKTMKEPTSAKKIKVNNTPSNTPSKPTPTKSAPGATNTMEIDDWNDSGFDFSSINVLE